MWRVFGLHGLAIGMLTTAQQWHQREALTTMKTTTSVLSFTSILYHLPCMPTAVLSWRE